MFYGSLQKCHYNSVLIITHNPRTKKCTFTKTICISIVFFIFKFAALLLGFDFNDVFSFQWQMRRTPFSIYQLKCILRFLCHFFFFFFFTKFCLTSSFDEISYVSKLKILPFIFLPHPQSSLNVGVELICWHHIYRRKRIKL